MACCGRAKRSGVLVPLALMALAACSPSESLPVANPFDTVDPGDCGAACTDIGTDRGPDARDPGTPPTDLAGEDDAPVAFDPGPDLSLQDPGPQDPGPEDPGLTDLGPACTTTPNCALGQLCLEGHCAPGCQSERDCPNGMRCDPADGLHGACKECLVDDDCDAAAKCVQGTCASVCVTDMDCTSMNPALPRCSSGLGVCVACLQDSDCTIGNVCDADTCVAGCRGDRDCVQPLRCDLDTGPHGACVQCLGSGDCTVPQVCEGGSCVIDCAAISCPVDRPRCLSDTGDCVTCIDKGDCGTGKVCTNFQCWPGCAGDADCQGGWHCKAGGNGTCVQCLLDGQCAPGSVCRNDVCVVSTPICHQDSECKAGQYCHPVLNDCHTIPPNACTPGVNCGFLGLGGKCDPLTRTCIDSCSLGICGLLSQTTTPFCIDGGCYECGTSADCPGTQCSLFDRTCSACRADADCLGAQTRCDTSDGKCYGCLTDGQCGAGKRCEPVDRVCVDCLTAGDCKVAGKPVCGKDGTCIATCSNECTKAGDVFCVADNPDAFKECGDWDNDPCLDIGSEYGPTSAYACPPVQQCDVQPDGVHGMCVCHDKCTSGQSKCEGGYQMTCDQNFNSGCWYWGTHSCSSSTVCTAGQCVCKNDCTTPGATRCLDQYTLETCTRNSNGCTYRLVTQCSSTDKCWDPGVCSN
jgi:Cys-rich repeat protein